MTLIANFLLDHKLDGKPLYLHGMSSGATFALKLPRELHARQADLERCKGSATVSAKSERSKTKSKKSSSSKSRKSSSSRSSRRDLLVQRRSLQEEGEAPSGLGSINCKELPAYQFPAISKMQLILRQLRGIISSERGRVLPLWAARHVGVRAGGRQLLLRRATRGPRHCSRAQQHLPASLLPAHPQPLLPSIWPLVPSSSLSAQPCPHPSPPTGCAPGSQQFDWLDCCWLGDAGEVGRHGAQQWPRLGCTVPCRGKLPKTASQLATKKHSCSALPTQLRPSLPSPAPPQNIFQPDNRNIVAGLELPPIVFVAMSNDTFGAHQAPVHAVLLRRNGIPSTSVTVRGAGAAAVLLSGNWAAGLYAGQRWK